MDNPEDNVAMSELELSVEVIAESVKGLVIERVYKAIAKLTEAEIKEMGLDTMPTRLAKTVLCAVFGESKIIESQFASETMLPQIKKIKRKLKNRF